MREKVQIGNEAKKKSKNKGFIATSRPNKYQLNNFVLPPNDAEKQVLNLETSSKMLARKLEYENDQKSRNQFSSSHGKTRTKISPRSIFTSQSSRESENKFKTLNCIVEKCRVIQEEGRKSIKEYNSNINKMNKINSLYDFIWKNTGWA